MLTDNQKKWVAALRSGRYKQTVGVLKDEKGHCCLGVACAIAIKNKVPLSKGGNTPFGRRRLNIPPSDLIPVEVRKWLGLKDGSGNYSTAALWEQNDIGRTFSEIADIIESEPEGLFVKE